VHHWFGDYSISGMVPQGLQGRGQDFIFFTSQMPFLGYWHQRADEAWQPSPKVTRTFSGQRQSWKTPR